MLRVNRTHRWIQVTAVMLLCGGYITVTSAAISPPWKDGCKSAAPEAPEDGKAKPTKPSNGRKGEVRPAGGKPGSDKTI